MQKNYQTKYKAAMIEYLKNHKERRVSAADIYDDMTANGMQVNRVTVYRNLDKLTESGVLMKYKTTGEECCQYQYVEEHADCHGHLHMQCRTCGKIFHLDCGFMSEINRHLLAEHGFMLECSGSVLVGLCKECREAEGITDPDHHSFEKIENHGRCHGTCGGHHENS